MQWHEFGVADDRDAGAGGHDPPSHGTLGGRRRAEGCRRGILRLVGISHAEACSLSHELREQDTIRSQGFALLARCLEVHASRPRAIHLVPAPSGLATARLELAWSDGRSETTIGVGLALGLAVTLGVPLLVSEALLDGTRGASEPAPAEPPLPPVPPAPFHAHALRAGPTPTVPRAFRRAFD